MNYVLHIFIALCLIPREECGDPFERLVRLDCFKETSTGCSQENHFQSSNSTNSVENVNVTKFFLFTPENPQYPEFLHRCGNKLPPKTNFDAKARTEIFIHGHIEGPCLSYWMREMRDELFKKGRYNVIFVDYTWCNQVDYAKSTMNAPKVGHSIAELIKNIMQQTGVSASSFHLIGISLGAHVAGFAGADIDGLGRITGLDPALQGYLDNPPSQRLDRTDAELVDVIHTGSVDCSMAGFGDIQPTGDVDFYPNGGSFQKSCFPYVMISILKGDVLYGLFTMNPRLCSHSFALQYYKVSINPGDCEFVGVECDSYEKYVSGECGSCGDDGTKCAIMGMDFTSNFPKSSKNRKYYLNTTLLCPYCSLDPVAPGYMENPPKQRLDQTDDEQANINHSGSDDGLSEFCYK